MWARVRRAWPRPEIHRWHFVFRIGDIFWARHGYEFQLGFFKITQYPPEGEVIQPKHYKGFWLRWEFCLPEIGFAFNLPRKHLFEFDPDKKYFVGVDIAEGDDKSVVVIASQDKDSGVITIEDIQSK